MTTTKLLVSTVLTSTAFALAGAVLASCGPAKQIATPRESAALAWAYPTGPQDGTPQPLPAGPQRVPGSARTFTLAEVNDDLNPPDWFPNEHPLAPPIVAHGVKDGPTPCAECHLMNGQGFPGAANLNGLPAAYIIEQVHAFKSGDRGSSQSSRFDTAEMIKVAQAVRESDLNTAAAYFSALPPRPFVRVVETGVVPATLGDYYGWLDLVPGGAPEPIAGRIIEVPEDTVRAFRSDPHVGIVDYVAPGAVARGAALGVRGGGRTAVPQLSWFRPCAVRAPRRRWLAVRPLISPECCGTSKRARGMAAR